MLVGVFLVRSPVAAPGGVLGFNLGFPSPLRRLGLSAAVAGGGCAVVTWVTSVRGFLLQFQTLNWTPPGNVVHALVVGGVRSDLQ